MINKIYFGLLGVAILVVGFFTFYSYSWLHSIGSPEIAADSSKYFSQIGWSILWISLILLIVYANFLMWKTGKIWSLWITFGYFSIFMIMQTLWLAPSLLAFKKANGMIESNFSFTPFVGIMTIIVLGIALYADQYILFRLRNKIYGKKTLIEEESTVE